MVRAGKDHIRTAWRSVITYSTIYKKKSEMWAGKGAYIIKSE